MDSHGVKRLGSTWEVLLVGGSVVVVVVVNVVYMKSLSVHLLDRPLVRPLVRRTSS